MASQRVILTYKDYEALPADGRRYELHEGELSVTAAPSPWHQRILRNLNEILWHHVKTRGLGEVLFAPIDCILSETTVVQPDLVYLDTSRLPLVSDRGIEGPPTLVVEILSPATTLIDRSTKRQLYARHGVPYYWIVDPEAHTIEAYCLAGGGYQLAARAAGTEAISFPPFPELALVPEALWPRGMAMGVYDQIKTAFQDIIAPEIRALHGEVGTLKVEIHRLDEKVDSLRNELNARMDALRTEFGSLRTEATTKIDALEGKLIAEIRRVDTRIDSLERELKTRLDSLERELKIAIDIRERLVALEAKARP